MRRSSGCGDMDDVRIETVRGFAIAIALAEEAGTGVTLKASEARIILDLLNDWGTALYCEHLDEQAGAEVTR